MALNRRMFLQAGVLGSVGMGARVGSAAEVQTSEPPLFTTSINIEIMFPRTMARSDRIKAVAAQDIKVYSFWRATAEEQKAMLEAQQQPK